MRIITHCNDQTSKEELYRDLPPATIETEWGLVELEYRCANFNIIKDSQFLIEEYKRQGEKPTVYIRVNRNEDCPMYDGPVDENSLRKVLKFYVERSNAPIMPWNLLDYDIKVVYMGFNEDFVRVAYKCIDFFKNRSFI